MHEVFVSYSSVDENAVRKRLQLLKSRGIPYWFAPDAEIPGGEDFASFIETAISNSKVFLLMASESALGSEEVKKELALADNEKVPIIPLFLETELSFPPGFRYRLLSRQYISATEEENEEWVYRLLKTLRYHGVAISNDEVQTSAAGSREKPKISSGLMPYLADRDQQEALIQKRLEQHLEQTPHRPILFIIHGEESHCCDMFVERLCKYSIPRQLKPIKRSDQLECKSVRWPDYSPAAQTSTIRAQLYWRGVLNRLELPLSAPHQKVTQRIGAIRRPVLFWSNLGSDAWQLYEGNLIEEVVRLWSALSDVPAPSQPIIILLAISYPSHTPSLFERLRNVKPDSPVAQKLRGLVLPSETAISVTVLPELTSLSQSDIEEWVREIMQPNDTDDVLRIVRAVFSGSRNDAEQRIRELLGHKMEDKILTLLEDVFLSRGRSGRLPIGPLAPLMKTLLRAEDILRSI
ncbi:hypothetical protein COMA1_11364 [Candidatus Nitrospira nitrosa]|uniref:TIR domain-containing protein n=1 Tax=Candidatus Nitrospira nitrosa TaxID=1742972 RepID=A0A0S4LB40_9BACT|nr:TIR domain-containing protein [Candidatus Nitrospira nitrosa]CUS33832.1 hypothetical protein COMA1_11364 [Candidatus Nitrospira nitrosa]